LGPKAEPRRPAGLANGPTATRISVEPTERGEQLRLSTLKDDGITLNALGVGLGGMSALMVAVVAAAGKPAKALSKP